jgi:predicted lipoprotein with Yx(FWY)xxD motif
VRAHPSINGWIAALALAVVGSLPLTLFARPVLAGSGPPPVQVMTGSRGQQYLADANGLTLYVFSLDQANSGSSACSDMCAMTWPPLILPFGGVALPPIGLPGTLSTITRPDGLLQVTYNGQPLYRCGCDTVPGQMGGQTRTVYGGIWAVPAP